MGRSEAMADQNQLAAVYNAFAKYEAAGRSALYVEICDGIASEPELLSRLSTLPATKQQRRNFCSTASFSWDVAKRDQHMKNLGILGAVLIVMGVGALLFGHFTYSETKPVLDVGPLHINSQEDHTVWIPTVAGIVVVLAGLGLVMAGRRSS